MAKLPYIITVSLLRRLGMSPDYISLFEKVFGKRMALTLDNLTRGFEKNVEPEWFKTLSYRHPHGIIICVTLGLEQGRLFSAYFSEREKVYRTSRIWDVSEIETKASLNALAHAFDRGRAMIHLPVLEALMPYVHKKKRQCKKKKRQ